MLTFKKFPNLRWGVLLMGAAAGILFAASQLVDVFSYNRWDNFEYFTPLLFETHRQWLSGSIPYWNPHQHLGEPLLAQGQPGVFYPLYLVSYGLIRLLQLPADHLTLMILLLHLPIAVIGWSKLFHFWGVRPVLATATSLSITFGSYLSLISTVWGQMFPLASWLPWILYGTVNVIEQPRSPLASLGLIVGLTASALIGYPQMLIYTCLWTALFSILYATCVKKSWSSLRPLALPCVIAALFSAPASLPLLQAFSTTLRAKSFSAAAFLENSVNPQALLSLFTPVLQLPSGFMDDRGSLASFQGMWIGPVILGVLVLGFRERNKTDGDNIKLLKLVSIFAALSFLFFLLAIGEHGKLYPLTRIVPIWSSFRWPHKFLIYAMASLGLAAGLGLEWWARRVSQKTEKNIAFVWVFLFGLFVTGLMLLFPVEKLRFADHLVLIGGIGTLFSLPLLAQKNYTRVFLLFTLLSAVGVVAECHQAGFKTYVEKFGSSSTKEMGIEPSYRVLPVSPPPTAPPIMQSLGLFHSATMNGYFSATGCTTAMIPWWYLRYLPSQVTGVLYEQTANTLLGSQLLRAWNVRYVLVDPADTASVKILLERKYRLARENATAALFEDSQPALARAYFASHVFPYNAENLFVGLVKNRAPAQSAFIESPVEPAAMPKASILSSDWEDNRMRFRISAPQGGFLVASVMFYPDWNVRVDGKPAKVLRTNGTVQGVWVPPGGELIEFYYRSQAMELGISLAVIGLLILFWRRSWMKK